MRALCTFGGVGVAFAALMTTTAALAQDVAPDRGVVFLEQGWDEDERRLFYNEAQGSPIIPLDFFLALERIDGDGLFAETAHLASYGLIPEPKHERNPYGLPVGLTVDRSITGGDMEMLGMNCSACHVGRMTGNGVTVQIDGAPGNFDFWSFMGAMDAALIATLEDGERFARFAERLGASNLGELRARVRKYVRIREDWQVRNQASVPPGPGRVDALTVILNQVTAKMTGRPDNARPADAPVSYPFLWGAPYLTHVQYNGVAPNLGAGALARNVGQVLGVFGEVSLIPGTLPPGYPSSVDLATLGDLEGTLQTLTPPKWDDLAALGVLPPVDPERAERGRAVYARSCQGCHVLMDGDNPGRLASVKVTMLDIDKIRTDPKATVNFERRTAVAGPLEGRKVLYAAGEPICEETFANDLLVHVAVGVLANEAASHARQVATDVLRGIGEGIRNWLGFGATADTEPPEQLGPFTRTEDGGYANAKDVIDSIARGDVQPVLTANGCGEVEKTPQYRARPLNAIWATGPYLHNGSVPTIADLLSPPEERPDSFHVGGLILDAERLGYVSEPGPGNVRFETGVSGNSNEGHSFGTTLEPEAKRDLIEYLKTL